VIQFANNPWGVQDGLEAQRKDLWQVDLRQAISYFQTIDADQFVAVGLSKDDLPSAESALIYAIRVTLPVQKIASRKVIQGTVPRNLPGYFEPNDTAKIDFIHDAAITERSAIYTLVHIWRSIVRIGRVGGNGEETFVLPDETFKPQFKFDINLNLLSGASVDGVTADTIDSTTTLESTTQYTLTACWPRVIQQGDINRGQGAQVHVLGVQFALQEVI
jgi:hypothetical protein